MKQHGLVNYILLLSSHPTRHYLLCYRCSSAIPHPERVIVSTFSILHGLIKSSNGGEKERAGMLLYVDTTSQAFSSVASLTSNSDVLICVRSQNRASPPPPPLLIGMHNLVLTDKAQGGAWSLAQMNNYSDLYTKAEITEIISPSQMNPLLKVTPFSFFRKPNYISLDALQTLHTTRHTVQLSPRTGLPTLCLACVTANVGLSLEKALRPTSSEDKLT